MDANGVRTPGVSRKRTEFESSTLLSRPRRSVARLLPSQGREPGSIPGGATKCRMGLIGYGRRSFTAENRVRAPDATQLVPPVDSGIDATNVEREGSIPSGITNACGASAQPRLISAARWGQHPPQARHASVVQ